MKKDFSTDKLGMYGDPDGNFVIPGDLSSTPITTKYLQRPIIATSADGTTKILPPGMDNIRMPSNTVLEMKYQMGGAQANAQAQQQQLMQLISMYCQKVGGGDQSCAQKVAQSLQKNPEQMIQQMMAAVQEGQPQGQMEEEEEDEIARDGGCIDCQEAFPQAQNLNWFYKAQGGEAFPQANMYPEDWANYSGMQYKFGGMSEAFPQAQTYLPYDRPGETRLNGMFQKGGTLYEYVKSVGLDPSFKSRKELFKNMFDEEYTGTAQQNMYLLNALKSNAITLPASGVASGRALPSAERPKLVPPAYQPTFGPGKVTQKDLASTTNSTSKPNKSALPKASEAKKDSDQRRIPQTGVIVDKRTGEAVVLGPYGGYQFPVLTGLNVEGEKNDITADDLISGRYVYPGRRSTPRGYYMMDPNEPVDLSEVEGNLGLVLNPIAAYGMAPPDAVNVGIHGTYNPAVRNQFYTRPGEERNVSYGCINCRPSDYTTMMANLGGPDTLMVVDSQNPSDRQLFDSAVKQKGQREQNRQAYTVTPTIGGMPTSTGTRYEYGGQTLDQVYQMMKRGGLNYDPKKKKGKQETFEEYQMRMGGLSKYQGNNQSQVGPDDYENLNAWQKMRMGVKDFFTEGSDASINVNRFPDKIRDNRQIPNQRYDLLGDNYTNSPDGAYDQLPYVKQKYDTDPSRINRMNQQNQQAPQQQGQQQSGQDQRSAFGPGSGRSTGQGAGSDNLYNTYQTGQNFTNMFGNKAGAWSSIIGGGLSAMAGFGSGFGKSKFRYKQYDSKGNVIDKGRLKGESANIAASNLFNRYGQPQQQQQVAQQQMAPQNTKMGYGFNVPHMGKLPDMVPYRFEEGVDQIAKPPTKYFQAGGNPSMDFKYTTYTGPNEQSMMPSAWSAGVADAFELNRREEELEKMAMRSTGMSMVPATTAQKTQAGSPQGAINAPGFVPKTTVGNFGQDTYMQNPMMNYAQYGGMMMDDLYEDGGEYDLDDMTPEDRDELLRRLVAAGYDIEYLD
jgi:hypothetical protein